jgi:glycosyltransferase involved in cell wall biosynthesis
MTIRDEMLSRMRSLRAPRHHMHESVKRTDVSDRRLGLSVIVPVFEEAATITDALARLDKELRSQSLGYEVIVVADGCTDGTAEVARAMELPHQQVVEYSPNRGKGYAVKTGAALAQGRLVAYIDGDLDIHPSGLVTLIRQLETTGVDAVVASKLHRDSVVHYPVFRRMQSRAFRLLVRMLFKLNVADSQTGLKVFRSELIRECLPKVESSGFAFDLELLVLANDAGFRVAEGPVALEYQFSTTTGVSAIVTMLRDVAGIYGRRRSSRSSTRRSVVADTSSPVSSE